MKIQPELSREHLLFLVRELAPVIAAHRSVANWGGVHFRGLGSAAIGQARSRSIIPRRGASGLAGNFHVAESNPGRMQGSHRR